MNNIQTFDFADQPVRIIERNNQPWFVVADVCRVLGLANPRQSISDLDDDDKSQVDRLTVSSNDGQNGGAQYFNIISESGLYILIFKSRKETARSFRKWVTSEVLPTIRRTGGYGVASAGSGIAKIQKIIEQTIVAVHEGRCPIPKATVISILSAQYLRSQALMHPLPSLPNLPEASTEKLL